MPLLDLKKLQHYENWIEQTALDVYYSVIRAGGWHRVFPGPLPRWASRIRQYFNLTPMTLKLYDDDLCRKYIGNKAYQASSGDSWSDNQARAKALSGEVYEDELGRIVWFQMSPGGGIYHFKEKIKHPTIRAIGAHRAGQEHAPVFKLVSPDGTDGSREICIENPFDVPRIFKTRVDGDFHMKKGHKTIGAVNEVVKVANRIEKDSVAQGSYNYAETTVMGLSAHERLDVHTDPMQPGYYVEPPDLFKYSELWMRRFPENDPQGKSLAAQTGRAP